MLGIVGLALLGLAALSPAASLPRDTLWRVEQTCVLNKKLTGFAYPCLSVEPGGRAGEGFAVLRAPFRDTHIVLMPLARTTGVEASSLVQAQAVNYFAEAWAARHFVEEEVKRKLAWSDIGLAVNSRLTRSQDQLHIHVECIKPGVRQTLAQDAMRFPVNRWEPDGFHFGRVTYWTRRVGHDSLTGINPIALAREIPLIAEDPGLLVLAVLGITGPDGADFVILAGRSDPAYGDRQSTSEDLLDHSCRQGR